jgi:hypothetical protein
MARAALREMRPRAVSDDDPDALQRLAVRSAAVAAELAALDRAEEAEGLDAAALGALTDRRTLAELELADIAAELAALDAGD